MSKWNELPPLTLASALLTFATKASPTFTGVVSIADGAVGTPSLAFASDPNTGLFSGGADVLGLQAGGVFIANAALVGANRVFTIGDGVGVAQYIVNGAAGSVRDAIWQTNGSARFIMRVDSTAEGGANAGSDWTLLARSDAGSAVATAMAIKRSTGNVGFGVSPANIQARVHIAGSADIVQQIVRGFSTQTSDIWQVQRSSGNAVIAAISNAGLITHTYIDAGTNAVVNAAIIDYESSGTPAANYGVALVLEGKTNGGTSRLYSRTRSYLTTAANASYATLTVLSAYDSTGERDVIGIGANGSAALLGFYNIATAPIAKPTVTGSRGANAALTSLLTQLAALGLITDSSS